MRPSIPHPLRERRHSRGRRPAQRSTAVPAGTPVLEPSDPAVQRVREAGGPADQASYNCACGHVFLAPVSTTVRCPRCHAGQAW